MKNLDLNAYGVVAMPKQEMQKTDGGIGPVFWLLLGVMVSELLDEDAQADFDKGRQDAREFWGK